MNKTEEKKGYLIICHYCGKTVVEEMTKKEARDAGAHMKKRTIRGFCRECLISDVMEG